MTDYFSLPTGNGNGAAPHHDNERIAEYMSTVFGKRTSLDNNDGDHLQKRPTGEVETEATPAVPATQATQAASTTPAVPMQQTEKATPRTANGDCAPKPSGNTATGQERSKDEVPAHDRFEHKVSTHLDSDGNIIVKWVNGQNRPDRLSAKITKGQMDPELEGPVLESLKKKFEPLSKVLDASTRSHGEGITDAVNNINAILKDANLLPQTQSMLKRQLNRVIHEFVGAVNTFENVIMDDKYETYTDNVGVTRKQKESVKQTKSLVNDTYAICEQLLDNAHRIDGYTKNVVGSIKDDNAKVVVLNGLLRGTFNMISRGGPAASNTKKTESKEKVQEVSNPEPSDNGDLFSIVDTKRKQ